LWLLSQCWCSAVGHLRRRTESLLFLRASTQLRLLAVQALVVRLVRIPAQVRQILEPPPGSAATLAEAIQAAAATAVEAVAATNSLTK